MYKINVSLKDASVVTYINIHIRLLPGNGFDTEVHL